MASKNIITVLKEAGCQGADLTKAAQAFSEADVAELEDLGDKGDDDAKVTANIGGILAKTGLSQETIKKLTGAILAAWKTEKAGPTPAEPRPANLPSSKSIKAVIEGISESSASQEEKKKVLSAFDKEGIIELANLGTEPTAADAALDRILKDSGIAQDKIGTFKSALKSAWQGENKTGGSEPPESTHVPAGAVDVQSKDWPILKAERAGSIETFKIPGIFAAAGTPFVSAAKLQPYQWLHLAKSNSLTIALSLKKLLNPEYHDARVDMAAFLWQFPEGQKVWMIDTAKGRAESRVSASIEEGQAYEHRMADAAIVGKYEFCEASVKASYKMDTEQRSYSKLIHVKARYQQDRCKLVLKNCLKVAPVFQHLIDTGLGSTQIKPEDQFDYFSQLFDKFGHVVPGSVYLGAYLEITRDLMSIERLSKDSVEKSVDTSIKAKYFNKAEGSANIGYATDDLNMRNESNCFENFKFEGDGGDPGQITDPQRYLTSANNPENWRIIYREEVQPITELLKLEERTKIAEIVERKKREAWRTPLIDELMKQDRGPCVLPPNRALPFFPQDHDVTLKSWCSAFNDGGWYDKQIYLIAENGVTDKPDSGAAVEDGRDADGKAAAPGDPRKVEGTYYQWCQPAPLRADKGAGDSPENSRLLWRIVYTGQASATHEPFFWIVTKDLQWALSAFKISNYLSFACLIPFDEAKKLRMKNSPPRWVLQTAVPPGRDQLPELPDENSAYFRIYNPWCNGYLGDLATASGRRKYVKKTREWVDRGHGTGHFEDREVRIDQEGPPFQRTMVRTETEEEFRVSVYTDAKNVSYIGDEGAQQLKYRTRSWLIQDRSQPTEKKEFPQLDDSYIEGWIKEHQSVKEPSSAIGVIRRRPSLPPGLQ